MRYLLDTNIVSEPLRPRRNPELLKWLTEHGHSCAVAAPTWHELEFGARRLPPGNRRSEIDRYLRQAVRPGLPVLPYDLQAAAWHAVERARLAGLGRPPPLFDGMIAAVAAVNGLVLVTRNRKDFEAFEGLDIQSWT